MTQRGDKLVFPSLTREAELAAGRKRKKGYAVPVLTGVGPMNRKAVRHAQNTIPSGRLIPAPSASSVLSGLEQNTLLERISVGRETQIDYERRLERLYTFLAENGLNGTSAAEFDTYLVAYMNECFQDLQAADIGSKTLAAFAWKHPEFSRHGHESLPRARQALIGWLKGIPPAQREPMTWLEVCGVAAEMVRNESWAFGVALLLMWDLYLRPAELFTMRVKDASPPMPEGGRSTCHWSFRIRPFEAGMPAKTGSFDDTAVLDHPARGFLGPLVAELRRHRSPTAPLIPKIDAQSFNRAFHLAVGKLGLSLVPYQARHGGPSHDRAENFRSLAEVRKRGRWLHENSTRRYEKHGVLQSRLANMDAKLRAHLALVASQIDRIMNLEVKAPRFKFAG